MDPIWISLPVIFIILIGYNLTDAKIRYKNKTLHVLCYGRTIATVDPRPIVSLKTVKFYNCPQPSSYAVALGALYVNVTAVQVLDLIELPINEHLNASNFKGLNIKSLKILYKYQKKAYPLNPTIDFWMYLTNLTHLKVEHVGLPPFPNDINLVKVELLDVDMNEWGGCSKLKELTIFRMDISNLTKGWNCQHLSSLHMERISPFDELILNQTLQGLSSLVTLKVVSSYLSILPKELNLFAGWTRLRDLDFSNNYLSNVTFAPLKSLQHLNLSNNWLDHRAMDMVLEDQTSLSYLSLSGNFNVDPCLEFFSHRTTLRHSKLERLELASTKTTELCFEELENLKYLDLRNTLIDIIRTSKYGFVRGKMKLLASLTLGCDCENSWLSRALRENLSISLTRAACSDGTELAKVFLEQLECDRERCRDEARNCTCRKRWRNQTLDADCRRADVQVMPRENHLHSVHAPNNFIKNIAAEDFPDSLLWVDLSGNRLTQIDPITLETIFNVTSRHIRLAGNPIVCDCDHQSLIMKLQEHIEQVEDSADLNCLGSNKTLSSVNSTALCTASIQTPYSRTWPAALLVVGGVLVALLVLAAALYCRYEYQLKMLLFAHGCLFWVREDDLDADRPYDVFLSFSHGNVDFVLDELLPGLEDGPEGYKVCIHFRDWVVGDWIPAQITRSVEQSRRTLIVLSEHFLESVWGILEFRTAYEIAVTERRRLIIIVALDDAVNNDERLDSELRTYLRNNTYLQWGDKYFWEKLRYALPHRHREEVQSDQDPAQRVSIQLRAIGNCSTAH